MTEGSLPEGVVRGVVARAEDLASSPAFRVLATDRLAGRPTGVPVLVIREDADLVVVNREDLDQINRLMANLSGKGFCPVTKTECTHGCEMECFVEE